MCVCVCVSRVMWYCGLCKSVCVFCVVKCKKNEAGTWVAGGRRCHGSRTTRASVTPIVPTP